MRVQRSSCNLLTTYSNTREHSTLKTLAMAHLLLSLVISCLALGATAVDPTPDAGLIDVDLFVGGVGGYVCYRLPNLVQMRAPGHLVAFGQGRKLPGCPDDGWMDSVSEHSDYTRLRVLWSLWRVSMCPCLSTWVTTFPVRIPQTFTCTLTPFLFSLLSLLSLFSTPHPPLRSTRSSPFSL